MNTNSVPHGEAGRQVLVRFNVPDLLDHELQKSDDITVHKYMTPYSTGNQEPKSNSLLVNDY